MFETIKCKTAKEFWGLFDPTNPLQKSFLVDEKEMLLYRGQEDSKFKLLPASFRSYFDKKTYESLLSAADLVQKEYNEFEHFIDSEEYINVVKEGIFKLDGGLKKSLKKELHKSPSDWPPKDIYDSLFLAQHHGVATRLLDWSKNAYAAVYFACQPLLYDKRDDAVRFDGSIAVWCYLPKRKKKGVVVENHPKNFDKNMIAQDGRFTLVKQEMPEPDKKFKIITLDDIESEKALWKITVPKTEIFELLSFCRDYKFTAETIYKGKGLDCVAMAYREKMMWSEKLKSPVNTTLINGLDEV